MVRTLSNKNMKFLVMIEAKVDQGSKEIRGLEEKDKKGCIERSLSYGQISSKLKGINDKISFFNEKNGYCIPRSSNVDGSLLLSVAFASPGLSALSLYFL